MPSRSLFRIKVACCPIGNAPRPGCHFPSERGSYMPKVLLLYTLTSAATCLFSTSWTFSNLHDYINLTYLKSYDRQLRTHQDGYKRACHHRRLRPSRYSRSIRTPTTKSSCHNARPRRRSQFRRSSLLVSRRDFLRELGRTTKDGRQGF